MEYTDVTLLQDKALTVRSRTYGRWMGPLHCAFEDVSQVVLQLHLSDKFQLFSTQLEIAYVA